MPTPYTPLFSQPRTDKSNIQARKAEGALDIEREPAGVVSEAISPYSPFGRSEAEGPPGVSSPAEVVLSPSG